MPPVRSSTSSGCPPGSWRRTPSWAPAPTPGEVRWRFDDSIGTGPNTTASNGEPPASEITIATPVAPAGRLLLASIAVNSLTTTQQICTPAGWTTSTNAWRTRQGNNITMKTFYRVATGTEAASYTWQIRAPPPTAAPPCGHPGRQGSRGRHHGVRRGRRDEPRWSHPLAHAAPAPTPPPSTLQRSPALPPTRSSCAGSATTARPRYRPPRPPPPASPTARPTPSRDPGVVRSVRAPLRRTRTSRRPAARARSQASNGGAGGRWVAQTIVLRMLSTLPIIELTMGDTTAQFGHQPDPDRGRQQLHGRGRGQHRWDRPERRRVLRVAWLGHGEEHGHLQRDGRGGGGECPARLPDREPGDLRRVHRRRSRGHRHVHGRQPARARGSTNQTATAGRAHAYWLGLEVLWTDAPSATLANATLTITAVVDW